MNSRLIAAAFVLLLGLCSAARAQAPTLEPNSPGDQPVPTVTFDLVFPGASPAHYAVALESTGRAVYKSNDEDAGGKQADRGTPYTLRFVVSDATRTRIFALARQANYFQGNFDSRRRVANTGAKTLTYGQGPAAPFVPPAQPTVGARHATSYNYSDNPAIQQLTAIFQGISASAELAGRLEHLRRFDRLGLDAELHQAEELARIGQYTELQLAAPALQAIVDDPSALNVARQRARQLLQAAQQPATRR